MYVRNVRNGPEQCFVGVQEGCMTNEEAIDFYYNNSKIFITDLIMRYCNGIPDPFKCVVFWNEGLHWHPNITRSYAPAGMTRALAEAAKAPVVSSLDVQLPSTNRSMLGANTTSQVFVSKQRGRKHYIMFRETTSQCFNRATGSFHGLDSLVENATDKPFCCVTPDFDYAQAQQWQNKDVLKAAHGLDRHWRNYIGWIHIFNHTLHMCDLRVEQNPSMPPDCTHFVYTPTSFDILWYESYLAFHRLLHHEMPAVVS